MASSSTHPTPHDPATVRSTNSTTFPIPCARQNLANSRRRKRPGFHVSTDTSPEFRPPPKVYTGGKYGALPPISTRAGELTRITQIPPTPVRGDAAGKIGAGRGRGDTKPKPYVLEPPPQAMIFPDNRCGDFFPWRGNHAEDTVTDAQARNGQYDKPVLGHGNVPLALGGQKEMLLTALKNEQASAKSSLYPAFKQRSGLSTLSTVLLNIMEKRQQYSKLTAASTFKPPPRVTLPEARREQWLRDLASTSVSLRKLSRTIPHGIKGPQLFEQCYAKKVPTARAVWFVRCVGANELRGLKRRGVGQKAYTGGEPKWIADWTAQVTAYLEKIVMGCTGGDPEWYDKAVYTIRLVGHLHAESLLDRTIVLDWYLSYLEGSSVDRLPLVLTLAPVFWDDILSQRKLARRFSDILLAKSEQMSTDDTPLLLPLFCRLSILTTALVLHHRPSLIRTTPLPPLPADTTDPRLATCITSLHHRINLLSSCATPSDSPSTTLLQALDDTPAPTPSSLTSLLPLLRYPSTISLLCNWATTPLRTGSHRPYLAASLLEQTYNSGTDIQTPILDFLHSLAPVLPPPSADNLFLLIALLVRRQVFSVASYMRWLIAQGALGTHGPLTEDSPVQVRVLAEVPTLHLSARLKNLRSSLLAPMGWRVAAEQQKAEAAKAVAEKVLRGEELGEEDVRGLQGLGRGVRGDVAAWVGGRVRGVRLSVGVLVGVRQVLEVLGEAEVLAEVVAGMVESPEPAVVEVLAETVAVNFAVFVAVERGKAMVDALVARYRELRGRRELTKTLLECLVELLAVAEADERVLQEVRADLDNYDQQYPRHPGARSPISESMDDIFEDEDEANEEINRLYDSGTAVDADTVVRLFETTVSNLENAFGDTSTQHGISVATTGLKKLAEFDRKLFGELVEAWVGRMRASGNCWGVWRGITRMVAEGCLSIETVMNKALEAQGDVEFVAGTVRLCAEENPFETALGVRELYTLKRKRLFFLHHSPDAYLRLIRRALELCTAPTPNPLPDLLHTPPVLTHLRTIATRNLPLFKQTLLTPPLPPPHPQLLLTTLLNSPPNPDLADLLTHTTPLSLPLTLLHLSQHPTPPTTPLLHALLHAHPTTPSLPAAITNILPPDHTALLRAAAEDLLLTPTPPPALLAVLHATTTPTSPLPAPLLDRLAALPDTAPDAPTLLLLLLKTLLLHRAGVAKAPTAEQVRLLAVLVALKTCAWVRRGEGLAAAVADVLAWVEGCVGEEAAAWVRRWTGEEALRLEGAGGGRRWEGKSWERLEEPSPVVGENDTAVSLRLFKARRTV